MLTGGFKQDNRGFTLLELIISFAIMVILLMAAVPLWQSGLRLWQRESGVLAVQQEGRIVLETVAGEIRRARKDSVEIIVDGGSGMPALKCEIDEETNTRTEISYLQERASTKFMRRKNRGNGAGTNVFLTNLRLQDGFTFAFVDPRTGEKRTGAGSRLAANELIELTLCCRCDLRDYIMQIWIAPRN